MPECELCGETVDLEERNAPGVYPPYSALRWIVWRCRDHHACLDRHDAEWLMRHRLNALSTGVR